MAKKKAEKPPPRPVGRPLRVFTETDFHSIEKLCGMQCTKNEICAFMSIDHETLDRVFKDQKGESFSDFYARFQERGKVELRRLLFAKAQGNYFEAIKWLSKQHLGMSEKIAQKVEVEDNRVVRIDLSFADEEIGDNTPGPNAEAHATPKKV